MGHEEHGGWLVRDYEPPSVEACPCGHKLDFCHRKNAETWCGAPTREMVDEMWAAIPAEKQTELQTRWRDQRLAILEANSAATPKPVVEEDS